MAEQAFQVPETFLKIISQDSDYSLFLLEGGNLIFFPA
jgi:hypothetical protein